MKISINTKNIELDNPLRVFIEEKVGSIEKLLERDQHVQVEIGIPSKHHKSGPVFYAEMLIQMGKKVLRANSQHYDLRAAITETRDELKREITKLKGKSADRSRRVKK